MRLWFLPLGTIFAMAWVEECTLFRHDNRANDTRMKLGTVAERIEIHMLRKRAPPPEVDWWRGLFDDGEPYDAWARPIMYRNPGPNGLPFDLVSGGADGVIGTADDILWSETRPAGEVPISALVDPAPP